MLVASFFRRQKRPCDHPFRSLAFFSVETDDTHPVSRQLRQIAFFETRAREVILYFRDMKPGEVKKVAIDLVATVPGTYTGPASSAYLYYNDTDKSWAAVPDRAAPGCPTPS